MSGPKVDVAELRRQEQKRLEEARKRRQELASGIRKMIDGAKSKSLRARSLCASDATLKKYGEDIASHYATAEKKMFSIIREIELGNETFNLSQAENRAKGIVAGFNEAIVPSLKIIDEVKKSDERAERHSEQMKNVTVGTTREIELFSTEKPEQPEPPSESAPTKEETISMLHEKLEEPELNAVHKESLFRLIEQINSYDGTDKTPQQRAAKTAEMYEAAVELCDSITESVQRLMAVYVEYEAAVFGLSTEKRPVSSFASIRELEAEIKRVEEIASADLSREYIARQINEVMKAFGYSVVPGESLEQKTDGVSYYEVDENTAIEIFVSDGSCVTMRTVGIQFSNDSSEPDGQAMLEAQGAFCRMHPQITAELEKRGVILTARIHNKPAVKYNKVVKSKSGRSSQGKTGRKNAPGKKTQYAE